MIISASRRTDIPAFYGDWFMRRIEDGYVYVVNPYNNKQIKRISLDPKDVEGIVFWTKNPNRFIKHLDMLDDLGYNYYFHFTLNDYPNTFEPKMGPIENRIKIFQILSNRIGKEKVIWRYDPIILSSITDVNFHKKSLINIKNHIENYTDKLIISFIDIYYKVKNRIKKLQNENNIIIEDLHNPDNYYLVEEISEIILNIFNDSSISVNSCAELFNLTNYNIEYGKCIDTELLKRLFNINIKYHKDENQRIECLCTKSVDIGAYNTCKFNCNYCYANYSEKSIERNVSEYNEESPSLLKINEEYIPKSFDSNLHSY